MGWLIDSLPLSRSASVSRELPRWAIELLARARETEVPVEGGCPVCAAVDAVERVFLAAAAKPEQASRPLRIRLAGSPLCRPHARKLLITDGRVPYARELLAERVEQLRALERSLRAEQSRERRAQRRARRRAIARAESCAGCELLGQATEDATRRAAERLGAPDAAESALTARGLCMRHLPAVLAHASPAGVQLACDVQIALHQQLIADTMEHFRKEDYRFRHEPKGLEQTAWLRGIARAVGPGGPVTRPVELAARPRRPPLPAWKPVSSRASSDVGGGLRHPSTTGSRVEQAER